MIDNRLFNYLGRKQKTAWNSDTKVTTTTFDDLFEEDHGQQEHTEKAAGRLRKDDSTDISKAWARNIGLDVCVSLSGTLFYTPEGILLRIVSSLILVHCPIFKRLDLYKMMSIAEISDTRLLDLVARRGLSLYQT